LFQVRLASSEDDNREDGAFLDNAVTAPATVNEFAAVIGHCAIAWEGDSGQWPTPLLVSPETGLSQSSCRGGRTGKFF